MDKPIRHDNHILETESNKFFLFQTPNEWFCDKPEHDYGIDYVVNIAIKNQVTGLSFSVQLKSKIKETNNDFVAVPLKHSTLSLFNTKLEPVLIVAYVREDKESYWCWYNELELDLTSTQKTYSLKIPKANKLSQIDWDSILKYVQNIFGIKMLVEGIKSLQYDEITNSQILAWKYYFSQDYDKSIFYFKNLLKENPNDVVVLEGLAQSQYHTFNYKEAFNNINKVIELSGTPNQYLTKACILAEDGRRNREKGKIIQAKNLFKDFLEKDNKQFIYHYNYANTLSSLGFNQEAIKHFNKCLHLNPNFEEAWKNLGQVYFDTKDHKRELECYDKALRINPKLPEALFSKGVTLSRIFDDHQNGLSLMLEAVKYDENMLLQHKYCYLEIAHSFEKTSKLKQSLEWINNGIGHYSDDKYYLNFKSNLLSKNWEDNPWLVDEALRFFEFRLELENDYKSLYSILLIKKLKDENQIFDLLKKHIPIFRKISFETLKVCGIDLRSNIVLLLHLDKYIHFRNNHSIYRYSDSLISGLYDISTEFWEFLDFIFAKSFSNAITQYLKNNDSVVIQKVISDDLELAINGIKIIFPDTKFENEEAIEIMVHICSVFPTILIREFGAQIGTIEGILGIENQASEIELSEEWFEKLYKESFLEINNKLKLLKEE